MEQINEFMIFNAEEIDKQVDEILKICEKEVDYNKIIQSINSNFHNRLIPLMVLDKELPSVRVYRVTTLYPGFNPDDVRSYSYPPSEKTSRGRANLENSPVFYAAFNPASALREMKDKLYSGDSMYLSEWEIKFTQKTYAYSLLINSNTLNPELFPFKIATSQLSVFLESLKNPNEDMKRGLKQFLIRTGDLFAMPGDKYYNITSAIAHQVLYAFKAQHANVSMIMYPSIESKHNGINFAIHPDVVDNNMMCCKKIIKLKVTNVHEEGVDTQVSNTGIVDEKENIIWSKPFVKINKIEYDQLIIHTYDESVFIGKIACNKKIMDTEKTLQEYLNQTLPDLILNDVFNTPDKNDFFNFDIVQEKKPAIFELEHGVQIETPKGQSCIKFVIVPVQWCKGYYKPFNL